ncbi:MAG: VUT family protein, partial [Saprospiraceae bacterium]
PEIVGNVTPWTWNQILAVGTIQYFYKISMAVLLTPVIYGVHQVIDRYLGKEESSKMKELAAL